MKGSEGVAILNISFASPSWEKLMKGRSYDFEYFLRFSFMGKTKRSSG